MDEQETPATEPEQVESPNSEGTLEVSPTAEQADGETAQAVDNAVDNDDEAVETAGEDEKSQTEHEAGHAFADPDDIEAPDEPAPVEVSFAGDEVSFAPAAAETDDRPVWNVATHGRPSDEVRAQYRVIGE